MVVNSGDVVGNQEGPAINAEGVVQQYGWIIVLHSLGCCCRQGLLR